MSKKLAAGAEAIVLDVKVGDGAFMKTLDDARELAEAMLELGRRAGREVVCLLTDMDQPLGRAVGNALEVREALATVRGEGPADFTELVLDACARLLALSDLGIDARRGRARAPRRPSPTARRRRRTSAGSRRRAATPTRMRSTAPRRPRGARAARRASSQRLGAIRVGDRRAPPRRRPADEGRRDRPRRRRRLPAQARRRASTAGEALAEVHARDDAAAKRRRAEVLAAYEIGDEPPPRAADRARRSIG